MSKISSNKTLTEIFRAALDAADPYNAVKRTMRIENYRLFAGEQTYDLRGFNRVIIIGAGKGTAPMALAVEELLQDKIDDGVIIVKYGHARPLNKIRQIEASHPLPDESGMKGTEEIINLLEKANDKTLVICLLSGGGSALLVSPADDLTLKEKQVATVLLLKSGASIDELNTVRKHMSKVKGGRLAKIAYPATIVTLILSDVIGDRLDVIASGPTVPDMSTFVDAITIVDKYGIRTRVPENVISYLESGAEGNVPDTPKIGEACFDKVSTAIIGSLKQALNASRNAAKKMGFDTEIVTAKLQGEAREAAKYLAEMAMIVRSSLPAGKKRCLISGGETTVTVKGSGLGGRNQELALAFALEIEGEKGITMLSAGTDGTDGPTDADGAVVDGETAGLAGKSGLDPVEYLQNNDSYTFFKRLDSITGAKSHLITGPTGTNVMDVQIILVEGA